jgi:hypothetical protein
MTLKFFAGLTILLVAFVLQFLFAGSGMYLNLALATLITFAFIFNFWELLVLDLLAVLIVNWQPAPSVTLVAFFLIPLAAFVFCSFTSWQRWIGNVIAIVLGLLIFYIAAAPAAFLSHGELFLMDLIVALIVGEIELLLMQ